MPSKTEPIVGTIIGVRDCGTIGIVFLCAEEGRTLPVVCDFRMLRHLLDGEGCGPEELVGRLVRYDGENLTFEE